MAVVARLCKLGLKVVTHGLLDKLEEFTEKDSVGNCLKWFFRSQKWVGFEYIIGARSEFLYNWKPLLPSTLTRLRNGGIHFHTFVVRRMNLYHRLPQFGLPNGMSREAYSFYGFIRQNGEKLAVFKHSVNELGDIYVRACDLSPARFAVCFNEVPFRTPGYNLIQAKVYKNNTLKKVTSVERLSHSKNLMGRNFIPLIREFLRMHSLLRVGQKLVLKNNHKEIYPWTVVWCPRWKKRRQTQFKAMSKHQTKIANFFKKVNTANK